MVFIKRLCVLLFVNTLFSSNITLVYLYTFSSWLSLSYRMVMINHIEQIVMSENRKRKIAKTHWSVRNKSKTMTKPKWVEKPRVNVWMCIVGERFVVDVIFRWNYSISTSHICSTELFLLLANDIRHKIESKAVLRAIRTAKLARARNANHMHSQTYSKNQERDKEKQTNSKLVQRKTNSKSFLLMCTFRTQIHFDFAIVTLILTGKTPNRIKLKMNIMLLLLSWHCQSPRDFSFCQTKYSDM